MENFVNFITDTINPAVINSYIDSGGQWSEFCGSDSSTADYTKMGWLMSCYRRMKANNQVDDDVKTILTTAANTVSSGIKNYKLLSSNGFNLIQQMVYDARSDSTFTFAGINDFIEGFDDYLAEVINDAKNAGGQSALHMMVEFGMTAAITDLGAVASNASGSTSTADKTSLIMAPYYIALKKKHEDILANNTESESINLFNTLASNVTDADYSFSGENSIMSGASGDVKNEMSRLILGTTHELIKDIILNDTDNFFMGVDLLSLGAVQAMQDSVVQADGLAASKINFSIESYASAMPSTGAGNGYTPLMYYINKYRAAVDSDVLNALTTKFSPLAISVDATGGSEGYNPLGLMAYFLTITEEGAWNSDAGAAFVKTAIGDVSGSLTSYKAFVACGNVRDITAGQSNNAFGAINNILVKINDKHNSWWNSLTAAEKDATNVNSFNYSSYADAVLPALFDYDFYRIWMTEYGKEISTS